MKTSLLKALSVLIILIVSTASVSYSQKVEKFCEVVMNSRVWSTGYKINSIDYGQTYFTFKDETVSQSLDSVMNIKDISSSVVILNYMSLKNWKFVSSYAEVENTSTKAILIHLLFKQEFDASEILSKQ